MSLLFIDSFDHYATADITRKWSAIGSGSIAPSISTSALRTGTQGLRAGPAQNSQDGQRVSVTVAPATPASGLCGFAFRCNTWAIVSANSKVCAVLDAGTEHFNLQGNSDGTLTVERGSTALGSTSQAIPANQWTFIEMKWTINNSTGSIEIRFNGTTVLTLSNVDTQNTANATWGTVAIAQISTGLGTTPTTWDYDDFYLCDLAGSVNNDFLGDMRVDVHYPNANGSNSAWTRSAGSDQYATIDELLQNGDTDYNSTLTAGNTDTVNVQSLVNAGSPISGVQVCACAKKEDAGGGTLASVVRHGSTDYAFGTPQGLTTSYLIHKYLYETNPGTSAAFTETDFNAAEFGYRKTF